MEKCAACGSVSLSIEELEEMQRQLMSSPSCNAVYHGDDFTGEALRCNTDHDPARIMGMSWSV